MPVLTGHIFEEGTILWAEAGASLLPVDDEHLRALEEQGLRRGVIEKSRYPSLLADVQTVDCSGWPVFCRTDTPDIVVEQFCRGLESAKDHLVWDLGLATQAPLLLARMVLDSPSTPFDVPLHPRAQAVWKQLGYLT
jgi:hypothetical protein